MILKNKVALITGSAQGMGKAMAVKFSEEGANVILTDMDEVKGKEFPFAPRRNRSLRARS